MIYLINQEWSNTSGNHAGIKYLCDQLQKRFPSDYISITIPDILTKHTTSNNRIIKKIQHIFAKNKLNRFYKKIAHNICLKVKDNDRIFLMEYYTNNIPQDIIAREIKARHSQIKIFAMPHLTPMQLDTMYSKEDLLTKSVNIDKFITLGSTLSIYLEQVGIEKNKIGTTFHYVDNEYYSKKINYTPHLPTVIVMGNNARHINLLKKIIVQCPNTKFIICQGIRDYSTIFKQYKNIELIGYIPENKLKQLMIEADISLNVMKDTVGSNVIVTSIAMGLAMIVSEVGSIRDYCDDSHTFFCNNNNEKTFIDAIKKLENNYDLLYKMQKNSQNKSILFSISNFHKYIQSI